MSTTSMTGKRCSHQKRGEPTQHAKTQHKQSNKKRREPFRTEAKQRATAIANEQTNIDSTAAKRRGASDSKVDSRRCTFVIDIDERYPSSLARRSGTHRKQYKLWTFQNSGTVLNSVLFETCDLSILGTFQTGVKKIWTFVKAGRIKKGGLENNNGLLRSSAD